MESEEFKQLQKKALEQLQTGQSLTGKDGVFAPLLKQFIESALEAEMQGHLDDLERKTGNKRNAKKSKTLKTSSGALEISTPQDRHSNFAPQLVKKRQTVLADNLAPKVIGLYGLGMSFRDIQSHIQEMYDVDLSATTLSEITDRVVPQVKAWQSRQLESLYVIVWLDAMHYKVREDGRVKNLLLSYVKFRAKYTGTLLTLTRMIASLVMHEHLLSDMLSPTDRSIKKPREPVRQLALF